MLKISKAGLADHFVILRLEGRLIGPWVATVGTACEEVLQKGRALKLHLAEVEFLDADGAALLLGLRSRGVLLAESPPFLAEQLKAAAGTS